MTERSEAMAHTGDESKLVRLTIPARAEYITLSRLALTGLTRVRPLPEDTLADLKLALTEACSNSVRHAYAGREGHVQISFELRDDRLVVEVEDDGLGFEHEGSGRDLQRDDLTEGGLGIAIIKAIADEFELGGRERGVGSRLRFVKLI